MKKLFAPLMYAALAFGCDGDTPLDVESPEFAVAGNSGCATVEFYRLGAPDGAPFTGDLQGTLTSTFDGDFKFAGATMHVVGTHQWNITGGVLGPLTFETESHHKNLFADRPGSPWYLYENIGEHRATSGVLKANLHFKGTYDWSTNTVDHEWKGVICP